MNRRFPVLGAALLAGALAAGCDHAGADRVAGVGATGTITGSLFFDANGSLASDASDTPVGGIRVRLLSPVSRDTLFRTESAADGTFRLDFVPVGSYAVVLDSASAGDSARVLSVSSPTVTVRPDSTVALTGVIGYPRVAASAVRTLPLGQRVFVTGVALHAREVFSDTLVHLVDTSGAIRAARVRPVAMAAGDSIRLRGTIAVRLGQRVLDDVTIFPVGPTLIPTIPTITTAQAATAVGGTQDAALVRVLDAAIVDTATVGGSLTVRVNDGSGIVTMLLDRQADAAFRAPLAAGAWSAGVRYDIIGVLVPTGTGAWRIRPRSAFDLTRR